MAEQTLPCQGSLSARHWNTLLSAGIKIELKKKPKTAIKTKTRNEERKKEENSIKNVLNSMIVRNNHLGVRKMRTHEMNASKVCVCVVWYHSHFALDIELRYSCV